MPTYTHKEKLKRVTQKESDELAAQAAAEQAAVEAAQAQTLEDEEKDLLDEIDGLLEEQEVLVKFRQRGGQ